MFKIIIFLLVSTAVTLGLYYLFTKSSISDKLWFAKKTFTVLCCFVFVCIVSIFIVYLF